MLVTNLHKRMHNGLRGEEAYIAPNAVLYPFQLENLARLRNNMLLPVVRFLRSHLRRHHLCHSSPLITNTHRPSLSLILQRPARFPSHLSSIPIHRRPLLFTAPIHIRCPVSPCCPFAAYTERAREEAVKEEEPSPLRRESQVGRYDLSVFVLGWSRSSIYSVDGRHQHRHVLEPTLPLPTQRSVSAVPSALVMTASGSTITMPARPTKGGSTLLNRIGSVKK